MTVRNIALVFAALAMVAASCTPATSDTPDGSTRTPTSQESVVAVTPQSDLLDAEGFRRFMAVTADALLRRNPEEITELGLGTHMGQRDDELRNLSFEFRSETAAIAANALQSLDTLPVDTLDGDEAVSASVLRWYLEDIVALSEFPDHEYAASYITGAHSGFPEFMADVHEISNAADVEAYISRLEAAGTQMRQVAHNIRRSEQIDVLPTTTGVQIATWQIGNILTSPAEHPLVADLVERLELLETMPADDIAGYRTAAQKAVREHVLPGYEELLNTIGEISGRSELTPGVSILPDGDDYYAAALKHHVTLDITPEAAHDVGLDNVERLVGELTAALIDLGYEVDTLGFAAAISEAVSNAGFFALDSDANRTAVLDAAAASVEEAEAAVAPMFEAFPESEIVVARPRPSREGGPGAYYRAPPASGTRPGQYYLSLGGAVLDKQTFRTTNFHEAVPGHHFQLALQRETAELPLLQRAAVFNGFAEGWALYAERLAFEAGLYNDDAQGNIGRLRMELLRAARVVADTGIHRLGWSRNEAISYMTNLGFHEKQASSEVDRYIVWPGQAPSYLIGMLEILRLRDATEAALGDDFDIASFHDEILRHGSLPLDVLDDVVDAYIAQNQ